MKSSTQLAISFGTIFGSIAVVLSLIFARFTFRKHRKGRSVPVDAVYEADLNEVSGTKKRWFGGTYGLTPIAERGKGGTKQYMSGWFALDAPTSAGWVASDGEGAFEGNEESRSWRKSHFSRASRAFNRSKSKKGPRPSRTTELSRLEQDKGEEETEEKHAETAMSGREDPMGNKI
ncbi:uncharacterized protein JCM6883_004690 [Sporobolomyces salmoneus]|uniref:uncharacterized protein n=1 Tax=Sporobolomyces salmoneus TaxID=183962 RepID=UPI003174FB4B